MMRVRLLSCFLLLALALPANGESRLGRGIYYEGPWWSFTRVGMLGALQQGNFHSYFGELSWNPWLAVTPWFAFRGNIGATWLKASNTQRFFVSEYQLFFSFADVGPITIEPGIGAQTWWGHGESRMLASLNILFPVDEESLPWFRYLFIGYSAFFLPNLFTNQAKVGIEVTLW